MILSSAWSTICVILSLEFSSLLSLQYFYIFIEFVLEILDHLHNFIQPYVYISLGITQELIIFESILLKFIGLFLCVFFTLLKFFGQVYDWSFKFCLVSLLTLLVIFGVRGYFQLIKAYLVLFWLYIEFLFKFSTFSNLIYKNAPSYQSFLIWWKFCCLVTLKILYTTSLMFIKIVNVKIIFKSVFSSNFLFSPSSQNIALSWYQFFIVCNEQPVCSFCLSLSNVIYALTYQRFFYFIIFFYFLIEAFSV